LQCSPKIHEDVSKTRTKFEEPILNPQKWKYKAWHSSFGEAKREQRGPQKGMVPSFCPNTIKHIHRPKGQREWVVGTNLYGPNHLFVPLTNERGKKHLSNPIMLYNLLYF